MPTPNDDVCFATVTQQGLLASASFVGIVLSSHGMGFLADTWGRVKTLRVALIFTTICTLISAFSVNIWMLIAFRFLTGFFVSGSRACVFTLCGEFHSSKSRSHHVTLLSSFLPVALVYLPVISTAILPVRIDFHIFGLTMSSWRVLLMTNAVVAILAVIGLETLPETPRFTLTHGKHDETLETLRKIFVRNTGRPAEEYPVKRIVSEAGGASISNIHSGMDAIKMMWRQTAPLFYKERCLQTLNICFMLFMIYGLSHGVFMWFPTILNDMVEKADQNLETCRVITELVLAPHITGDSCAVEAETFSLLALTSIGVVLTIIYLVFAYTIDFIGKKNLLIIWLIVCTLCCVGIHWNTNFALGIIGLGLIISTANVAGVIGTIAMEFFPTNINAMAMCFIMLIGRLGAVVSSNIFGHILFNHCDLLFWILSGFLVLLIALGYMLPVSKPRKK